MPGLLYIIDTFSLMFQVFHAIPEMTSPRGQPTNAVFGFARDLQALRSQADASHVICALDSSGPGTRNETYSAYKANRKETPVDLEPQIPLILELIEGHRVPAISVAGWEADDVIATVVRQAVAEGLGVRIVTSDKDARQLLGPRVAIYNARKNTVYDVGSLQADWGIRPDQVVDFQSLVGDAIDNVPGVPFVGPKKASALLAQFGTLDDVLANADKVQGAKLRENLKAFADQARISRQLVELNSRLPFSVDWEAARLKPPDRDRLLALFTELGFRRFADAIRASASQTGRSLFAEAPAAPTPEESSVSMEPPPIKKGAAGAASPGLPEAAAAAKHRGYRIVDNVPALEEFVRELAKQKRFCVDLETTSLDAVRADIVGWAFSWQAGMGFYIPVNGPPGERTLDPGLVVTALKPVLENTAAEIVNQNIKYDMLVLRRLGIELGEIGVDPMVGDYLLDAGARTHSLDTLAERYLGHRTIPISDLIGTGAKQKKMFDVPVQQAAEYAAEDAQVAFAIADVVAANLKSEGLWDLYWNLERPLIRVLTDMEFAGIRVDVDDLKQQSDELAVRLVRLVREIHADAGTEFNIDSPIQLRKILFAQLGLPIQKRTKTGPSTDQDVLERLALLHPLPAKIIEHRQLSKLKGTYLDALPAMVNPETGRIHCSFNQVVAATGRLSSSDPNLQNIPIRTPEGRRVRRAFLAAEPGWKLLCADYSQIELRMLAHFSQDPALQSAFRSGADIHTAVAAEIFTVADSAVTSDLRRIAKAVNFGVIYGQSPFGLSAVLAIGQDEAARFIESYFERYAGVDRHLEAILRECAATGYARTILGRRREISGIRDRRIDFGPSRQRNLAERTAINTVIQGSAADLIKKAMLNLASRLRRENSPAKMLLQIHDELVFDVPADHVNELAEVVRQEMEHALELDVPLAVDVSIGDNWLDLELI